jgi:hypothetical protein
MQEMWNEEESSYHSLAGHRMNTFSSAWVEPIDISRASTKLSPDIALRAGTYRETMDPKIVWILGANKGSLPRQYSALKSLLLMKIEWE